MRVCVCTYVCGYLRRLEEELETLEPRLQVPVSPEMELLRAGLRASGAAGTPLYHRAVSLAYVTLSGLLWLDSLRRTFAAHPLKS